MIIKARSIVPGNVSGLALVSRDPISFYGGVDPETGVIVEPGHSLEGEKISGKILIFPYGKGSTVGSYIIYRLKKRNLAPLAIVNLETEPIIVVGCVLSRIPLVDKPEADVTTLIKTGDTVTIKSAGKEAWIKVDKNGK
ncbi:MAG: DUF126 domain-containing protein [Thermoproteales archaeon]|nr:DUF126 domain-containing protein [Thermoproteales archaeon]